MLNKTKYLQPITAALIVILCSCVPKKKIDPYQSLMDQGILALSTDNAFAGANVFLSEELEQSQYLYEFFKGRGAPVAIELNRSQSGAPRMVLYYPNEKQAYVAALAHRPDFHEWIVRGPYAMQRKDYRELEGITASLKGAPLFQIDRRPFRFKENLALLATPVATPVIKPKSKPIKKTAANPHATAAATPALAPVATQVPQPTATVAAITEFKKLNSDQKAIMMSKGFAERADNGDIIHTVKRPEETLSDIARWYTDLENNAEELAKVNSLAAANTILPPGTKIRVPMALIKQDKQMPTTFASGKIQRGVAPQAPVATPKVSEDKAHAENKEKPEETKAASEQSDHGHQEHKTEQQAPEAKAKAEESKDQDHTKPESALEKPKADKHSEVDSSKKEEKHTETKHAKDEHSSGHGH